MSEATDRPGESLAEFTLRAVVAGAVFGVLFGAANTYLGLRVGLTVSTSIPIAVLTVVLFRLLRARGDALLEANLSQTIGSASSSLASGVIFTVPALFLWGMVPPFWQVAVLAGLGGILGVAAMVPLRRLLIVRSAGELPYPEGTACAEVLQTTLDDAHGGGRWLFFGLLVGAAIKLGLGGVSLLPSDLSVALPALPKARLALEIAPALLGVGSLTAVLSGLRGGCVAAGEQELERTDRDVPGWIVLGTPAVVLAALVAVPGLLAGNMDFLPRLVAGVGVAVFGALFVVVSSRIVGLIGV